MITVAIGRSHGSVPFVFDGGKGWVHLGQAIDVAKERRRIEQELSNELRPHLSQLEARLNDASFKSKAPADVLVKEQERRQQLTQRVSTLEQYLETLK